MGRRTRAKFAAGHHPSCSKLCRTAAGERSRTHPLSSQTFSLKEFARSCKILRGKTRIDYDLINAVFGEDADYQARALADLLDVRDRATFLQTIRNDGRLAKVYETVNRASKLAAQGDLSAEPLDPTDIVNPDLFEQPTEQAFYDSLKKLVPKTQAAQAERDYSKLIAGLEQIAPTVANFFDGETSVMVMAEDLAVRKNRLNLLGLLRNHARVLADFSEIVKS